MKGCRGMTRCLGGGGLFVNLVPLLPFSPSFRLSLPEKTGGTARREALWAVRERDGNWTGKESRTERGGKEETDLQTRGGQGTSDNHHHDHRSPLIAPEKRHPSLHQSVHLSIHLSVRSLTQNKVLPSPPAPWRVSACVAPPPTSLLLAAAAAAATASREAGSKPCSAPRASASIFTLSARKAE